MEDHLSRIYKADDGNHVQFFTKIEQDMTESEKAGRPIAYSRDFVRVIGPGNPRTVPEFPMAGDRLEIYAEPYKKWKQNQEATGFEGTPLKEWPAMPSSRCWELAQQGVHTVEMLAGIPDAAFQRFGPDIRTWRDKAQAFVKAAEQNAPVERLSAELRTLKESLAQKDEQINALIAGMGKQANEAAPKPRGWPKGKPRKPQAEPEQPPAA